MMELSKNFAAAAAEEKWYKHWLQQKYFNSTPDNREAYTIVIPPPNVTGILHMGHCLNNSIQDVLCRRARMEGKNVCWVPGTDHASIATEAKVVNMLREKGITKSSLSRQEFLKYAWEWKEKYGGIILKQLEKLGCSIDWDRVTFTMDDHYYKSVIKVFVDLHNKGIIYRGKRMVNWDPASKTALSDEEVIFKEIDSKLYYINYHLVEDNTKFITVATTRPETILGDVAICVNPTDERYAAWIGKEVMVPLINRKVPIIADEYVDATFGTGALKITPAHDKNDHEIGKKYHLQIIDTLDESGLFSVIDLLPENPSNAILAYNGVDRFKLRKQIIEDIVAIGQVLKIEDYKGQVGTSERTGAIIESRLSLQWFMNMQAFMQRNPEALSAVMNDEIIFHPEKAKNTYSHWLNNIKDWCISRQLWWGQQIPAWYDADGNCYVAETKEAAEALAKEALGNQANSLSLLQDEDCLDTWFSSWLWPMEVFKGISQPNNTEVNYYYPTATLVTGQDIIFFWVARMIMAGNEYRQQIPFKHVYFTGMVRDKQGRKMSKQLGNSPDLLGLIDAYGADAVRFGIMIASPAGNDLLFDESALEQGRNFNNKLWNALKLLKMWQQKVEDNLTPTVEDAFANDWFSNRINEVKIEVEYLLKQFKISEALKTIYSLIWDDYCSWYLEWIKPAYEQAISQKVYDAAVQYFEQLMQLLHPFMPFITEEIFHLLQPQTTDLCVTQLSKPEKPNSSLLAEGTLLKQVISILRDARNKNQLKPKDAIELFVETKDEQSFQRISGLLTKQINASSIAFTKQAIANSIIATVEQNKFYLVAEVALDAATLKANLIKDLDYQKSFYTSVERKLSNEKFVQNAKQEVVEMERKKMADAAARIKTIEESLANL